MNDTMSREQAKILRDDAKLFGPLVRGFHLVDHERSVSIRLDGKEVWGEWYYGYLVRQNGKTYVYGGLTLHNAKDGLIPVPVEVDSRTVCRCTGLILRCENTRDERPIFEYDVVEARTTVPGMLKNKTFVFNRAFVFWHAPTLSWGIIDIDTGDSYPINSDWSFVITGTVFNSDVKLEDRE